MSLPSHIEFLKDGKKVLQLPCNIGWFDRNDLIAMTIVEAMQRHNERASDDEKINFLDIDYDSIRLYGRIVDREKLRKWFETEITNEQLIETFKQDERY